MLLTLVSEQNVVAHACHGRMLFRPRQENKKAGETFTQGAVFNGHVILGGMTEHRVQGNQQGKAMNYFDWGERERERERERETQRERATHTHTHRERERERERER